MYKDSVVKLVVGEFETTIDFKIGVKQGDSVAPVLFLFIVMAFAKTLEKEWTLNGLTKAKFSRKKVPLYPTANSSAIHRDLSTAERSLSSSACSM